MGFGVEKPLLKLGKQTLLERSVAAVGGSTADDLIISTTPWTPKTSGFAIRRGWAVLETPGADYHDDVYFLLDRIGSYISINVDIPFITPEAINRLISKAKEDSIACVIPRESVRIPVVKDSLGEGKDGREYVWIGLNYVTASKDTDLLAMDDEKLAININSPQDLALAQQLLPRETHGRGKKQRHQSIHCF